MLRLLIDTNVMLDLLVPREPWEKEALLIKGMAYFGDADLWVPAKSFTDIFYVMRRSFDSETVQRLFLELEGVFHLCSLEESEVFACCRQSWPDLEDCLVAYCAEKVKADYLVTRDAGGFPHSTVPAVTPQEFLEKMQREYRLYYDIMDF